MRILLVTDAWHPQVNGVVRTLATLKRGLEGLGHEVTYITPDLFRTIPCPTYPEIRLALWPGRQMRQLIDSFRPCAIHIATEGSLGLAAWSYCRKRGLPFTTAFHTKFPEYLHARFGLPPKWTYAALRRFHGQADAIMVATPTIERELRAQGFDRIKRWSRGVDTEQFRPRDKAFLDLPRPILLYVGRVAVEKNIEAFLTLDTPGTKVVIGDGPLLPQMRQKYQSAVFLGAKHGEDLARHYAAADVFVFPSLTDTFGLVLLEALASGVPVAAYPVAGPLDVIADAPVGCLHHNLGLAIGQALTLSPQACRAHAETYSWAACTEQFLANIRPFDYPWGQTPVEPRVAAAV
ncbi:MAG: glycosyltransferase family 1 protein [Rhodospirillaceae bacterium]|nr:glycosyltransferase family 1 protein [Rhodospirillaceae bacterium]